MTPLRSPFCCLILTFLLFFAGCTETEQEEMTAVEVAMSLERQMVIGGGAESGSQEPILANVNNIATGPEGNIFIYDSQSYRILQYTASGAFVNSFGRQGRGPAEFESVSCLYVDSRGRIIVSDFGNTRFSVFDGQGEMILNQPQLRIRRVRDIKEMPDGRFLVAGWHPEQEKLLHILSPDFSRIEASFGTLGEITAMEDEPSLNQFRFMAGHTTVLEEGRVAFAPSLYSGTVFIYESDGGENWTLAEHRLGYSAVDKPIDILSGSTDAMTAMSNIPPTQIISITVESGTVNVTYKKVLSHAFFRAEEGKTIHLYSHFGEEGANLVAERFDGRELTFNRYGILPLDVENVLHPLWMDPSGDLFASESDSALALRFEINGL